MAQRVHVQRNIWYVLSYLAAHPCVDCGEDDPVVLEFDHVQTDKVASISDLVHKGYKLELIVAEIEKCEVRCANCHRRAHHRRRRDIDDE